MRKHTALFKEVKERVLASWLSSLLGAALFIAAILSVFLAKAGWMEATTAIMLALWLLAHKESRAQKSDSDG